MEERGSGRQDEGEQPVGTDPNSFVGTRKGYTGAQSLSIGADGANGSFNREAKIGAYAETKGSTSGKYGTASYDAAAKVEAKASVDAKGKLDTNGLDASINARVGVSAEAPSTAPRRPRPSRSAAWT